MLFGITGLELLPMIHSLAAHDQKQFPVMDNIGTAGAHIKATSGFKKCLTLPFSLLTCRCLVA